MWSSRIWTICSQMLYWGLMLLWVHVHLGKKWMPVSGRVGGGVTLWNNSSHSRRFCFGTLQTCHLYLVGFSLLLHPDMNNCPTVLVAMPLCGIILNIYRGRYSNPDLNELVSTWLCLFRRLRGSWTSAMSLARNRTAVISPFSKHMKELENWLPVSVI